MTDLLTLHWLWLWIAPSPFYLKRKPFASAGRGDAWRVFGVATVAVEILTYLLFLNGGKGQLMS